MDVVNVLTITDVKCSDTTPSFVTVELDNAGGLYKFVGEVDFLPEDVVVYPRLPSPLPGTEFAWAVKGDLIMVILAKKIGTGNSDPITVTSERYICDTHAKKNISIIVYNMNARKSVSSNRPPFKVQDGGGDPS